MLNSNTYSQLHVQLVFAVKFRKALIHQDWQIELYKYISGIIAEKKHKLICINGMTDHIHILIGWRPHESLSDIVRDIKRSSSLWINQSEFCKERFEWQSGFGAFSYSKSALPNVIRYIENQQQHHQKKSFVKEYVNLLEEHGVEYDQRYIFKDPA
jgi:putative transposase